MAEPMDERTPLLRDSTDEGAPLTATDSEVAQNGPSGHVSAKKLARIVLPMAIGLFLSAMDQTIIFSTYARIGSEFNQLQSVSWIATSYMLTLTCFQPLYGKMSDIFGRKSCLLFAYTIFGIGSLLCGLARTLPELVGARALAGVGGGGLTTVAAIVMSDVVPLRQRGTWQGVLNIVYMIGSASGAPLGGFLTDGIGWRWAFIIQVPIAVAAILAVSLTLHLPNRESEHKTEGSEFKQKLARVDFAGAFFLITSVFSLLVWLDRGSNTSWSDVYAVAFLIAFVVLGAAFIIVEFWVVKEPLLPKRIITQPSLFATYLYNFFNVANGAVAIYYGSLYLQVLLGKSPAEVGLLIIPTIAGYLLGSLGGGVIIQTTGKFFWLTFASGAIALVGALLMVLSAGIVGRLLVPMVIGLVLGGLGNSSGLTTALIALIATAAPEDQAIATAVSYLFRSLGSVVSLAVASGILQIILRSALRTHLSDDIKEDELEEVMRRVRESLDTIDEVPGAKESYEIAIQGVLWFTVILCALATFSTCWIKEKKLH